MQFEICEDDLNNKDYFEAVYKEACELTAYYCQMYKLDPKGTVSFNGVTVPVILDHTTSHSLKLGSNHGDVKHWLKKYGKTLDDVRNDVALLMEETSTSIQPAPAPSAPNTSTEEIYRIRKSWDDAKSQIGAYHNLEGAIRACKAAGNEYKVYDSKGN
jgi:hypothetical protein